MVKVIKEKWNDQTAYLLENRQLRVWVVPENGMNISQIEYRNQMVIKFDEERYKKNQTYSIPILYPTPNRVKDLKFIIDGVQYDAKVHGFAREQKFQIAEVYSNEEAAVIEGVMQIRKGTQLYKMFPFESLLKIQITVLESEIKYKYTICNNDDRKLPYGFAIHPFFYKNNEEVIIQVNAEQVMCMTEEKLPTGKLIDVKNTEFDLKQQVEVNKLQLDHVYTKIYEQPSAKIVYKNFSIELSTTSDFSHIVVYTPANAPFFCIENQTCSTDAHNMYNKGFKECSGLEFVLPGEEKNGEITFKFI